MITLNGLIIPKVIFPDGTMKLNIPEKLCSADQINICWKYAEEKELLDLVYVTGQLKQVTTCPITLFMPYLPNARMDRIHDKTEVFTLKYFCKIINSLEFDKVYVLDVHSSVGIALLDNAENISPVKLIRQAVSDASITPDDCIFFPDEGSFKRYSSMLPEFRNVAFGIKERDWDSGQIKGLSVHGADVSGKNVMIIDDICAYGGTVYHSAIKLKELGCKNISVYFTHCENSIAQGKLFECGLIKNIFTTDSICTLEPNSTLTIYRINNNNEEVTIC